MANINPILLYQTPKGPKLEVHLQEETLWLTQAQIAMLFDVDRTVVTKHLKNIFISGELDEKSNVQKMHIPNSDKPVHFYNLDAVISVGYRVNSKRATQFRIWATQRLKEYLIKGFAIDDERLKKAGGGQYFDELLARIRDIRSSEKVFWKKVLDIYATSIDYNPSLEASQQFFATIQNKMHWAAHGHTAAELISKRANAKLPNMGLTNWTGTHHIRFFMKK
jgi:hypothetical protein